MTAIALPDLISTDLLDDLRLEFPRFSTVSFGEERVRDQGRAFRRLADRLASEDFLKQAAELVGTDELECDPDFMGAGLRGASQPALPGWWHGRIRQGWWPRAGLVVNLTPQWRDPFTDGKGVALLTKAPLPEALALEAPATPDGPCLAILATLYSRNPPHLEQLPPMPEMEEPEPAAVPLEMPASFGRDPARFEADLTTLRALVESRGPALERALAREAALAKRVMLLVERPFWDGTGPFTAEEAATVRQVVDGRTALLELFAKVEAGYQDAAREVLALPHPPLDGPATFERIDGYWRDRWVTSRLELALRPSRALTQLQIRGYIPRDVTERLRFTATVGKTRHTFSAPAGDFVWQLPLQAPPDQLLSVRVQASHQWIPSHDGESPDPRALSWLLLGIDVQ